MEIIRTPFPSRRHTRKADTFDKPPFIGTSVRSCRAAYRGRRAEGEPAMRTRLIGSLGLCLTAAGLALGDGVPTEKSSAHVPSTAPADESAGKPVPTAEQGKPEQLKPPVEPGRLQPVPPAGEVSSDPAAAPVGNGPRLYSGPKPNDLTDDHAGPWNTYWVNLEYLWWWTKDGPLPVPLVANGAAVLGNTSISYGDSPGGRVTAGIWLDGPHVTGFEASGFLLARNTVSTTIASDGNGSPLLVRPLFNVLTGAPASFLVSSPGTFAGEVTVSSKSRLWGAEAQLVRNVACTYGFEADLLFGFRYLDLDENLSIAQTTTNLTSASLTLTGSPLTFGLGSVASLTDSFTTRNHFYGAQ